MRDAAVARVASHAARTVHPPSSVTRRSHSSMSTIAQHDMNMVYAHTTTLHFTPRRQGPAKVQGRSCLLCTLWDAARVGSASGALTECEDCENTIITLLFSAHSMGGMATGVNPRCTHSHPHATHCTPTPTRYQECRPRDPVPLP